MGIPTIKSVTLPLAATRELDLHGHRPKLVTQPMDQPAMEVLGIVTAMEIPASGPIAEEKVGLVTRADC